MERGRKSSTGILSAEKWAFQSATLHQIKCEVNSAMRLTITQVEVRMWDGLGIRMLETKMRHPYKFE